MSYLRINHRRFFSEGRFTSQGGLTVSDLTSNLVSGFKSHINIKDFSIEFGVLNKVDWNEGKSQSEVKESPEKEKIDTNESN